MRKEQYNSLRIGGKGKSNFTKKKPSWVDNFIKWLHRFLETSE
jgi:hypothetical protein